MYYLIAKNDINIVLEETKNLAIQLLYHIKFTQKNCGQLWDIFFSNASYLDIHIPLVISRFLLWKIDLKIHISLICEKSFTKIGSH